MGNDQRPDDVETRRFESNSAPEKNSEDRWVKRRLVIYLTLVYCAAGITYLLFKGSDTRLNETIANGLLILASSVIAVYVGGSAYEDTRISKSKVTEKKDPFR